MTLNMTVADALVSILLGVVGTGLWIWIARVAPKAYGRLKAWWALLSVKNATRRVKVLQQEQLLVDQFKNDPANYSAEMTTMSLSVVIGCTISIIITCFVIGGLISLGQLSVVEAIGGDTSKFRFKTFDADAVLALAAGLVVMLGFCVVATEKVKRYRNLPILEQVIRSELARLAKKIGRHAK